MAHKHANDERDMIQRDTEKDRTSTTKAQHGSRDRESEFDVKMDFDLEDDYNAIEPR